MSSPFRFAILDLVPLLAGVRAFARSYLISDVLPVVGYSEDCFSRYEASAWNACEETFEGCGEGVCGSFNAKVVCAGEPPTLVCGDGVIDELLGEECDDGNTLDGDGCAHDCQIETALCQTDIDCVRHYNDACLWNRCDRDTGFCEEPMPRVYGDVCGNNFAAPPNGAGGATDILCGLAAFGAGNLHHCPNADIAVASASDCPRGNGVVNLTDILRILDVFGYPSPSAEFFCVCPMNPW